MESCTAPGATDVIELTVSANLVTVTSDAGQHRLQHVPAKWKHRVSDALSELSIARHAMGSSMDLPSEALTGRLEKALLNAGAAIGEYYLGQKIGALIARRLDSMSPADRLDLRIHLDKSPELSSLPWETLTAPGTETPLCLHLGVTVARTVHVRERPAVDPVALPGPLRILVVLANPDGIGAELDLEAEQRRVLLAVEPARREADSYVEFLNEGTLGALSAALERNYFHVLHLACHAGPGIIYLEQEDGSPDPVTAEQLNGVLQQHQRPPLVLLAGCSTALPAELADDSSTGPDQPAILTNLAEDVIAAGTQYVVAMTSAVSDLYAGLFIAKFYEGLAEDQGADVAAALSQARRELESDRRSGTIGTGPWADAIAGLAPREPRLGLVEWATPTLYTNADESPLCDNVNRRPPRRTSEMIRIPGMPLRPIGQFVGRRAEARAITRLLDDPATPGVVIHGIGGLGKSTLAAEVVRRMADRLGLLVTVIGAVDPDQILEEMGGALLAEARRRGYSDTHKWRELADYVKDSQIEWQVRLADLHMHLLPAERVTLLLDNAETGFSDPGSNEHPSAHELREFVAAFLSENPNAKAIFTSRSVLSLSAGDGREMPVFHLGPLSYYDTVKLFWRLPGLDRLSGKERQRAYLQVGGHPRTLEYLDMLLMSGKAAFPDISERLGKQLAMRKVADPSSWIEQVATAGLDGALAEAITLAVDDTLLHALINSLDLFERALLISIAVYRRPAEWLGLVWLSAPMRTDEDPAREARLDKLRKRLAAANVNEIGFDAEALGYTEAEFAVVMEDVAEERKPPLKVSDDLPEKVDSARRRLAEIGLITLYPSLDYDMRDPTLRSFVHRWTASTLADLYPEQTVSAHRRAAEYYTWLFKQGFDGLMARETGLINLLEAYYHLKACGDRDEGLGALLSAAQEFEESGNLRQSRRLYFEALDQVEPLSEIAAWISSQIGNVAHMLGEYDLAKRYYERAIQISTRLGQQNMATQHMFGLGAVEEQRGNFREAEEIFRRVLAIDEEINYLDGVALVLGRLSRLAYRSGKRTEAKSLAERSLAIKEELGNFEGVAVSLHQLAMIAGAEGDQEKAVELYERSMRIYERLNRPDRIAEALGQLANLADAHGESDKARAYYQDALLIFENAGNRSSIGITLNHLGRLALKAGDTQSAADYAERSRTMGLELQDQYMYAAATHLLGLTVAAAGRLDVAIQLNLTSLSIFLELDVPEYVVDLHWLQRYRAMMGTNTFDNILRQLLNAERSEYLEELFAEHPLSQAEQ